MGWTFDQWVAVVGPAGSWIAAFGTIAAAGVALFLARRSEKVRLEVWAGTRVIIGGALVGGAPPTPINCLAISVTNLGARPVTVHSTGWCIGKGKSRRRAIYFPSRSSPNQFGKAIDHGQTAQFVIDFEESPGWMRDFATEMVQDGSTRFLKTLRAQVHTSVGHTETVKPDKSFLDEIQEILAGDGTAR